MSALEQEIIQKIKNLDGEKKLRVLEFIRSVETEPQGTLGEWLEQATTFRLKLREKYGAHHFPSADEILNEVREERLNDIMRSLGF